MSLICVLALYTHKISFYYISMGETIEREQLEKDKDSESVGIIY